MDSGVMIGLNSPPPVILIALPFSNPTAAIADQSSQLGILESMASVRVSKALATISLELVVLFFRMTVPSTSNVPDPCPSV